MTKTAKYSPWGHYQLFRQKHKELSLKARSKTLCGLVFDVGSAANQANALVIATINRLLSNSKASSNHEDQVALIKAVEDDQQMKLWQMFQGGLQMVLTCLFYIQGENQQNQKDSFCSFSATKQCQNYRHLLDNHEEKLGNPSKAYSKFLSITPSQPIRSSEEFHPKIKNTQFYYQLYFISAFSLYFLTVTKPKSSQNPTRIFQNSQTKNQLLQAMNRKHSYIYKQVQTHRISMEIEATNGISRKSRGILYQLKQQLNSRKLTLIQHIYNIFKFQKKQYNKKQFFALIQKYDNKLLLSELDQLFDDLDQNRNQKVFYYYLKAVYQSINQADNPQVINRNNVIRTASKKNRETIVDIIPVYTEVRKVLLQSEDILEILHIFASQHGGYLTAANIADIFNNLGYNNQKYRKKFIQSALQGNEKILLDDLLSKLDMNQSARRSTIRENKSEVKIPHADEVNKSQFIRNQLKESKIDESLALNLSLSKRTETDECIDLENIPASLRPYFNYGSELETIFAHTAKEYIQTNSMFIDPQNPPYSFAYQWIHLAETSYNYELFQMAKSVLVRERNRKGLGRLLQPKDIIQGNLGDCYFLSAVAGVVEKYPELVYRLFVLQKNPSHLYGVRLFIQGMWRTIILDACFPVNRNGGFCAAQPHHHEIWVMLLEKAWAKVYGSYDNIHAGYNQQGLNAVSGAPSVFVSAKENEFVRRVEVEINKGSIITCATSAYVNQLSKKDQDRFGIFENHAYSLLNIHSNLKSRDGSSLTLVKIRNPWGKKEWQGNWGFRSDLWTNQLRKKLDYEVNPKDGTFFMSHQDFSLYFDHVNICRVNLAYKNSWIEVTSDRQEFKAVKIRVKQKGDYYFTLYQENPRRHSGKPYQKSKSWIFLLEEKNGKIQAIGSCCKDKRDNTLEVTLDVGEYIVISKIQWKLWEMHTYCLSSYGPEKVIFTPITFDIHMLSDFIESKAKLGFGKKSFYDSANILKRVQFSPDQGYGFILINNQENIIFDLTIRFQSHRGLTILPPYSLPIRLQIFPGEEVICKFLVDPTGYAYSLKESYNYLNAI